MRKFTFVVLFISLFTWCEAQYADILNFNSTNGLSPYGSLTPSATGGDTLYGMSSHGGVYNAGCIFLIHHDGSGYTDLVDFDGITNGAYPLGSLIDLLRKSF